MVNLFSNIVNYLTSDGDRFSKLKLEVKAEKAGNSAPTRLSLPIY